MAGTPSDTSVSPNPSRTSTSADRKVVLVVGAGRSGTSTLAGILKLLGVHVPQPEVTPDETNPKGFSEPQWVVEFHQDLLRRAAVIHGDARPQAWTETARVGEGTEVRERLRLWLEDQLGETSELVVKDPRTAWFLGLWRETSLRSRAAPCFATMLRPPTEVIGSNKQYYGGQAGDTHRVASWTNMMLHTERVTRDSRRAFLRYHDLLGDWEGVLAHVNQVFDLRALKNVGPAGRDKVSAFVDPSLRRIQTTWDEFEVVPALKELAEETWQNLNKLAESGGDEPATHDVLDELGDAYDRLYTDAEALTWSSAQTARMDGRRRERQAAQNRAEPAAPPGLVTRAVRRLTRRAGSLRGKPASR